MSCHHQTIQVQEHLNDHQDQWENNAVYMSSSSMHRRYSTEEGGGWSSSGSKWVWDLSRRHWSFLFSWVWFSTTLVVSWRLYWATARLDVDRIAGVASWDLQGKGIYYYNSLGIEMTGLIADSGNISKWMRDMLLVRVPILAKYESCNWPLGSYPNALKSWGHSWWAMAMMKRRPGERNGQQQAVLMGQTWTRWISVNFVYYLVEWGHQGK